MSSTKLKNAPLKEVIFELHWECNIDSTGVFVDKGFDLGQGKFADKLKPDFSIHRKLIPDGTPFKIFGAPLHQYWKGELKWPVVQHGQGMIAINEVEQGYEWSNSFKPLIIKTIQSLIASYEEQLKFSRVVLQYIDACDMDNLEPVEFMVQNLQTNLITQYPQPGKLRSFNIQQSFNLNDLSLLNLNISNGINNQNQKQSTVWTTTVEKQSNMSFEQIVEWIDFAHTSSSEMFKKMLNPSFYASLD